MDQIWGIPGGEDLHESTEANGGASAPNPLVQLDPGLFIWTILTFLILFYVLAKFAWKPLLTDAESEEIMSKARSEAQTIRVEAKSAAEKIKADVMVQAGEDAKKIRDDAQKQINVEKDKAIHEIRQEVVSLTMMVAEKVIRKNLSKEDNQSLIEDSIQHLKGYDA